MHVIKFIKMTTFKREQTENTGKRNRHKILTYINPFEQNNDHKWLPHEIEFRSSFNHQMAYFIKGTFRKSGPLQKADPGRLYKISERDISTVEFFIIPGF